MALGRSTAGEQLGETLVAAIMPAAGAAAQAERRRRVYDDLGRLAVLLKLHHFRHGSYPETLRDLEVDVPPPMVDRFTGMPLRYEPRGRGYVLWSVGANLQNDYATSIFAGTIGGEWVPAEIEIEGDDLVVRVPLRHAP